MRQQQQEPATTKEKILTAAAETFADQGFAGARVEEIARRAGVNKALLYYHMGDKSTLYSRVILANLEKARQLMQAAVDQAAGPEERFRAVVQTVARMVEDAPYLPRLLLREAAQGGQHLPDEVVGAMGAVFETIRQVLQEGRSQGVFRTVDPLLTHFLIAGSILFLTGSTPLRQRLCRLASFEGPAAETPEEIGAHVSSILLHGLLLPPDAL